MKTRILLVDDHCMFREGLASLINLQHDMESFGSVENGREALRFVAESPPDLVIIDVGMPEMNGIETVTCLRESFPSLRMLALSGHSEHHTIVSMFRAGALGYVLKENSFSELVEAIHQVLQGRIFISQKASGSLLLELLKASESGSFPGKGSAFSILTSRQIEILQAITEGYSTKEIALRLSISVKTVETHRQQLMEKLNIHSIAELTKYAIREEITNA